MTTDRADRRLGIAEQKALNPRDTIATAETFDYLNHNPDPVLGY